MTFCFGFNDWDGGMRGPLFEEAYRDAVDRENSDGHPRFAR